VLLGVVVVVVVWELELKGCTGSRSECKDERWDDSKAEVRCQPDNYGVVAQRGSAEGMLA